jgi:hypothetical protein
MAVTVVVPSAATASATMPVPGVSTLLYFPPSLEQSFGFDMGEGRSWKTLYSEAYGGGAVQTQAIYPAARQKFTGPSFYLPRSDRKLLRQFFDALNGRANPCYFFFPDTWEFDLLKIGTTSGAAGQVIQMRLKASSIASVVVGGLGPQAFTFAATTGIGGEDSITITNAQTIGLPIYVSGYGRLRFKARLVSDDVSEAWWSEVQQPYAGTAFEFEEEFEIF